MKRLLMGAALAAVWALPLAAQSGGQIEGRVGKLESEMRAVQRKIFPGGTGVMVEPQIAPTAPDPAERDGVPATSALADMSSRVASLEQQMATMTGQIEQSQYRLRQLEEQFAEYRKATDARLAGGVTAPVAGAPNAQGGAPFGGAGGGASGADVIVPEAPRPPAPAAVDKPSTGDAGEDAYLLGYRFWQARQYDKAATQLKKMVADYPKHRRVSFAQNLLGRTYLDDNKPSLASIAFYDNYKKYPEGERAPDSLYYLGTALLKLDKPADACKVYGELVDVYGGRISAGMKADVAKARVDAKCK